MELPNREDLEQRFAKRFGKVARRHMREFRKLLGNPPDLRNVPEDFYEQMQREVDNELYAILLLIFDESALYHGWSGTAANLAAYGWAHKRAIDFSKYWVDSSRSILQTGFDKLNEPEPVQERTVEEAMEAARPKVDEGVKLPTKEEISKLVDKVFGPHRIAVVAVDETTRAQHAGAESAVDATVGLSTDDLWRVQESSPGVPDEKVCPLCRSVNRVKRKDWPWRLSEGPPCHPNDRCYVEYANVPVNEAVGRMLEDSDYKSLPIHREPFDLNAWYRTAANAPEWRAHCRKNEIEIDDLSAFKSFNA